MSPTAVSSHKLAAAIADALRQHVPTGVAVHVDGDDVYVQNGDESWAGSTAPGIVDDPEGWDSGEETELLETAALSTLNGVQDGIARATTEQWPPVPPGGGNTYPETRVSEGLLHMWFGDEAAPVLRLAPIPLGALAVEPQD